MTCAVVHAGALGDSVMLWPLVRTLARAGEHVIMVASPSHGVLAAREINRQLGCIAGGGSEMVPGVVSAQSTDAPLWRWMWGTDGPPPAASCPLRSVYTAVADADTQVGREWIQRCSLACGGAQVVPLGQPGSADRARVWHALGVTVCGSVPETGTREGGTVLWVGAGAERKCWPLERWYALAQWLRTREGCKPVRALAGVVERERFSPAQRVQLAQINAHDGVSADEPWFITDVNELADTLRSASLVVCADSGPAHLAAQLGARTVTLFGPTDPAVWAPVGPKVHVVAPTSRSADMTWLRADAVAAVLARM